MQSEFVEHVLLDSASTQTTRDGYLVANPRVARTGIQLYAGSELGLPDRATVRVYRPESEVFSADALRSLAHRPITNDHPPEMITSHNWRRFAVGHSGGDVARDGDCVRVPLVLMDEAAIAAVRAGKAQLSVGYSANIQWGESRTPLGEVYDAVQTGIRANHIAVVSAARGGSHLRLGDSAVPPFHDGLGNPAFVRPGYIFGGVTDEQHRRVVDARNEYIARLTSSWRGTSARPVADADAAEGDACEAAYGAYVYRLENAWRGHR